VFGGWDDTETGPNMACVRRQLQKSEPFLDIGGQPTHSYRTRCEKQSTSDIPSLTRALVIIFSKLKLLWAQVMENQRSKLAALQLTSECPFEDFSIHAPTIYSK